MTTDATTDYYDAIKASQDGKPVATGRPATPMDIRATLSPKEAKKLDSALLKESKKGRPDLEKIKQLLLDGANPDITTSFWKKTPLIFAATNGNCDLIRLLISNNANPDLSTETDNNKTALTYALKEKHQDAAILLLLGGADIKTGDCSISDRHHSFEDMAKNAGLKTAIFQMKYNHSADLKRGRLSLNDCTIIGERKHLQAVLAAQCILDDITHPYRSIRDTKNFPRDVQEKIKRLLDDLKPALEQVRAVRNKNALPFMPLYRAYYDAEGIEKKEVVTSNPHSTTDNRIAPKHSITEQKKSAERPASPPPYISQPVPRPDPTTPPAHSAESNEDEINGYHIDGYAEDIQAIKKLQDATHSLTAPFNYSACLPDHIQEAAMQHVKAAQEVSSRLAITKDGQMYSSIPLVRFSFNTSRKEFETVVINKEPRLRQTLDAHHAGIQGTYAEMSATTEKRAIAPMKVIKR